MGAVKACGTQASTNLEIWGFLQLGKTSLFFPPLSSQGICGPHFSQRVAGALDDFLEHDLELSTQGPGQSVNLRGAHGNMLPHPLLSIWATWTVLFLTPVD